MGVAMVGDEKTLCILMSLAHRMGTERFYL